jgi:NADH-quinone oxidoreductase subunit J
MTLGLLGAAAVAAALGAISARNPVHCVLWLLAHLMALAAIFLTLDAEFLALIQVLVNAGAVIVLFLFVISLLGPGKQAEGLLGRRGEMVRALLTAVVFAGALLALGARAGSPAAPAAPAGFGGVQAVGAALFGPQLLPFEVTALALLVAVVSVVTLAGRSRAR